MDADQFLLAFPDLTSILGQDEDAKQDVALRCWERRDSIRDLPSYARRAAKNRRLDGVRRQRQRSVPNSDGVLVVLADPKPSPPERVERAEAVRGILGAIRDLPPRQREAVEALDLRSERLVDAAARLGRTPGALRSDRWRGRHALREALTSYSRIAEGLNARGVPAKCGGRWYAKTVRGVVMRGPALTGDLERADIPSRSRRWGVRSRQPAGWSAPDLHGFPTHRIAGTCIGFSSGICWVFRKSGGD